MGVAKSSQSQRMDSVVVIAWFLSLMQFIVTVATSIVWVMKCKKVQQPSASKAEPEEAFDDENEAALEEHASLTGNAPSLASRRNLSVILTAYHATTSLFILSAASREGLHTPGWLCVLLGLAVAFYECVVWNFDIPGLSCHGYVANRSRPPQPWGLAAVCLTACTNSAPLALVCMFIVSHTVIGNVLFFVVVTYYVFVQVQYWWAPYFCNAEPHENVNRYLQGAEGMVTQLPPFHGNPVRPDLEHAILFVMSFALILATWVNFILVIVTGQTTE
eukprot:NODE_831_length_1142_cov_172.438243_g674_i0.p1 GENE.NODE_831_length_1142_cov_172.438243_g674_i0~~NODE_831_length_1142_cov_172.438243_g674_i0.p1  ORF type:complete len:283 (-),score=34.01 NODE_831_length_1142_cov_172.438243_g674_i0:294-1118(-)